MSDESPQSPDADTSPAAIIDNTASAEESLTGFGRHRTSLLEGFSPELIESAHVLARVAAKEHGGNTDLHFVNALGSITKSRSAPSAANVLGNGAAFRSAMRETPPVLPTIIGDVNVANFLTSCVAVVLKNGAGHTFVGSGVLIAPDRVLTASHVGEGHPPTAFAVSAATDVNVNPSGVALTNVIDAAFVPGSADLAVLLLQNDLNVEPAILANSSTSITSPVMIAGYGLSNNQEAGVRHSGSAAALSPENGFVFIRKLVSNGGVSTSNPAPGDSGGPAYKLPLSNPPVVIGIHETMPGGVAGFGGFYELVAPLREAILNL